MDRSFPTGHNFHAASDLLGEEKPGKLLPKHKAIIMYFMYGADVARLSHASHGAANFMWKAYGLEIRGTTIEGYYTQTRKNAKDAGVKWDQDAVAHIIRSLVKDQDTFYEVFSFLERPWQASPSSPISVFHLHRLTACPDGDSLYRDMVSLPDADSL